MEQNFFCITCEKGFVIGRYRTKIVDGETQYCDKKFKELVCDICSKPLVNIKVFDGFAITYGKFASSTPEQRAKILDKRSHEHFLREIKEKKVHMDKNVVYKGIS